MQPEDVYKDDAKLPAGVGDVLASGRAKLAVHRAEAARAAAAAQAEEDEAWRFCYGPAAAAARGLVPAAADEFIDMREKLYRSEWRRFNRHWCGPTIIHVQVPGCNTVMFTLVIGGTRTPPKWVIDGGFRAVGEAGVLTEYQTFDEALAAAREGWLYANHD